MELLSYSAITPNEIQTIGSFLNRMTYLAITPDIENETIEFRRTHKTKLPDAIIAATALHHQLELLTMDKQLVNKI
jgi:predicted nucleic acid-binding protein